MGVGKSFHGQSDSENKTAQDGIIMVPPMEADFIENSTASMDEAARELFYRAWEAFDDGADNDEVDALLLRVLDIEKSKIDPNLSDAENDALLSDSYIIYGGGDNTYSNSPFADYASNRTMDALEELMAEMDEPEGNTRGPLNYSGTYKADLVHDAEEQLQRAREEDERNDIFMQILEEVSGKRPRSDAHLEYED